MWFNFVFDFSYVWPIRPLVYSAYFVNLNVCCFSLYSCPSSIQRCPLKNICMCVIIFLSDNSSSIPPPFQLKSTYIHQIISYTWCQYTVWSREWLPLLSTLPLVSRGGRGVRSEDSVGGGGGDEGCFSNIVLLDLTLGTYYFLVLTVLCLTFPNSVLLFLELCLSKGQIHLTVLSELTLKMTVSAFSLFLPNLGVGMGDIAWWGPPLSPLLCWGYGKRDNLYLGLILC
jgi:hypothetical protein